MQWDEHGYRCLFRCWGSLADFPKAPEAGLQLRVKINGHPAVKDTIEANGIPHPEVDRLLVNREGSSLDRRLCPGDEIEVFPLESDPSDHGFELDSVPRLIPEWEVPQRFALDVHLGKLARLLRLAGFNSEYHKEATDAEIVKIATEQNRIILTRDVALLKRGAVQAGYWVRSDDALEQACEVVRRYRLAGHFDPFGRCLNCNGQLSRVDRQQVWDRIPPLVKQWDKTIFQCEACGQLYWRGTHFRKLREKLDRMRRA